MNKLKQGLLGSLLGAVIGFGLTALLFVVLALLDGAGAGEAVGFGLAVGVAGGLMGGVVGLAIGALRLGWLGGAMTGAVATLAAVAFYVFVFGDPGRLGHFLRESGVVLLALGPPAVLTGVLVAAMVNRARPQRNG